MLPMLLFSLNSTDLVNEQLWLSSLKSFEILINESNPAEDHYLLPYTAEILDRLLFMANYERNMDIRITALRSICGIASNLSPNKIIQRQKFVCKQLEKSLNDKKRLCRQLAVEGRNRWFLLATKNGE